MRVKALALRVLAEQIEHGGCNTPALMSVFS